MLALTIISFAIFDDLIVVPQAGLVDGHDSERASKADRLHMSEVGSKSMIDISRGIHAK